MSTVYRRSMLTALCLGVFGYVGWSVYQSAEEKIAPISAVCGQDALGSFRINSDGSPQVCLER